MTPEEVTRVVGERVREFRQDLGVTMEQFAESAGLHRAHDAEVYAWADSEANGTGTVYVLRGP